MRTPSLAVILVNWRNEDRTIPCVAGVKRWTSLKPRVIVVDNQSTSESHRALSRVVAPEELICSEVNLGYGGGNNLGIARALSEGQEFILLLNSDAEILEAGVSALLRRLTDNEDVAILGPVLREGQGADAVRYIGGRDIARAAATKVVAGRDALSVVPDFPLHEVDYVSGTVFLARRGVFEQAGLLDEQFFFSGEIADLCKRARDSGHRACVDLEVEASRDPGGTPAQLRDTLYTYYSLRNRFHYARKHYPTEKVRYGLVWTKIGVAAFVRALQQRKPAKARAIALALAHAHLNRLGNQNAKFL